MLLCPTPFYFSYVTVSNSLLLLAEDLWAETRYVTVSNSLLPQYSPWTYSRLVSVQLPPCSRLTLDRDFVSLVFTDGPLWQEQRRFSLVHLRNLGLGKSSMEAQIQAEAEELVVSLRDKGSDNRPVVMHDAFDICVLNSLWALLAGHRFALNDKRLAELIDIVHASFRMLDMSGGLLNQMPFLRFLAPDKSGYTRIINILERMFNFLRETITEHRTTLNPDFSRDLIDSFLVEIDKQPDSTFSELQLLALCLDLFMAGSETTSNTLGFATAYMLLHPDIQDRVHQELDREVGRERQPALQDRARFEHWIFEIISDTRLRLSYIEAVLMEVQRHGNVVPVAVAHRATRTADLMGHIIPQGATLLVSLHSLHMDPTHWGDPDTFRPERFLDAQGKLLQDDWFLPFGVGKRRCLGETLARSTLFLFFTTLLHNFTLSVPPEGSLPSTKGYDGVTISPRPFFAVLTPRGPGCSGT
uniref:Cytochrome P450 n=2 Tax=Timema TaxID=61471 RepID=A0A7R9PRZ6_TIMGE|nr:unnamed protein product [Timema genevievae]